MIDIDVPGTPEADEHWLRHAVDLAGRCPPSDTAFSVGAVIVSADGAVMAEGFSRQDAFSGRSGSSPDSVSEPGVGHDHAEEAALRSLTTTSGEAGVSVAALLAHATIYSSLEPCSKRASRPRTCSDLIITAGLRRVVTAWREPPLFVDGDGTTVLRGAGITVLELPQLAEAARRPNAHLL